MFRVISFVCALAISVCANAQTLTINYALLGDGVRDATSFFFISPNSSNFYALLNVECPNATPAYKNQIFIDRPGTVSVNGVPLSSGCTVTEVERSRAPDNTAWGVGAGPSVALNFSATLAFRDTGIALRVIQVSGSVQNKLADQSLLNSTRGLARWKFTVVDHMGIIVAELFDNLFPGASDVQGLVPGEYMVYFTAISNNAQFVFTNNATCFCVRSDPNPFAYFPAQTLTMWDRTQFNGKLPSGWQYVGEQAGTIVDNAADGILKITVTRGAMAQATFAVQNNLTANITTFTQTRRPAAPAPVDRLNIAVQNTSAQLMPNAAIRLVFPTNVVPVLGADDRSGARLFENTAVIAFGDIAPNATAAREFLMQVNNRDVQVSAQVGILNAQGGFEQIPQAASRELSLRALSINDFMALEVPTLSQLSLALLALLIAGSARYVPRKKSIPSRHQ